MSTHILVYATTAFTTGIHDFTISCRYESKGGEECGSRETRTRSGQGMVDERVEVTIVVEEYSGVSA